MKKKNDSYMPGDKINGVTFVRHISKGTGRMAEFCCPICNMFWITRLNKVKNEGVKKCSSCSVLINLMKMKEANLKSPRKSKTNQGLKNEAFRVIKKSAIERCINFNIDKKHVIEIICRNCFYCNCEPNQIKRNLSQEFKHHGLDRVNNNLGYEYKNIVTCCKICNRAKNSMNYKDWLNYLSQLVNYRKNLKL